MGVYECANGRIYFTEPGLSYKNAYNENMQDPSSPCGYKLYVSWVEDQGSVCLTHSELVYYYNQARMLWDDYSDFLPNHPSNHLPIRYEINCIATSYNFVNGQYVPCLPWQWQIKVEHAKPNCTNTPTVDM